MIDTAQSDTAHLAFERCAVTVRQTMLVKPGMYHLMEQRRLKLLRMRRHEARREFDDGRTMTDSACGRGQPRIVDDAIRAKHTAEVARVEHRIQELEIGRARQCICRAVRSERKWHSRGCRFARSRRAPAGENTRSFVATFCRVFRMRRLSCAQTKDGRHENLHLS